MTPSRGTDPAHEVGRDGRTFLQTRLTTYAGVLFLFALGYFPAFYLIWSGDPDYGPELALSHIKHGSVIGLNLLYAGFWLLFRARVWSLPVLAALDAVFHAAVGVDYAFVILNRPSPFEACFEELLATMSVLSIRALLVPSSVRRSVLSALLMSSPPLLALVTHRERFSGFGVGFETLCWVALNWTVITIVFSGYASSVLYGLRRDVQAARKFGQYSLVEKLGEGGMGVVYRAKHAMLRRPTAIKLLNQTRSSASLVRFEQEAQLMADLTHPNNVTVHDYGCTADGVFYYAMEYLEGVDLQLLVDADGAQPAGRVIHILRQVCAALGEAHARGLIHRDIKPGNLFLCRDRGVPDMIKVLDFGVVKDLQRVGDPGVSTADAMVGTPHYMAPESLLDPNGLDARADLYALGAVGFFLLYGRPVFNADSAVAIAVQHAQVAPVLPVEGVPADLREVILRCLQKKPDQRFADAAALSAALDACADARGWTGAEAWWASNRERLEQRRSARAHRRDHEPDAAYEQTVAVAR